MRIKLHFNTESVIDLFSLARMLKITQVEIADRVGATHPQVTHWVKGVHHPNPKNLEKFKEFIEERLSEDNLI